LGLKRCLLGTLRNPHLPNVRCCLLYDLLCLGSTCGGDKGLWLGHVLRVTGDVLYQPSTYDASSLFEFPVSFVNRFCRDLGFTLATRSSSRLGWTRCGLRYLLGLAELASGGVLGHDTEDSKWVGDWDD
jgi:hypothetical protein